MHRLVYLPLARKDLENIISYIADELKDPQAALNFLDALDSSLEQLKNFPYLGKRYQPRPTCDLDYRMIPVKNYLAFYIVTDETVEVHRVIYRKMDIPNII